MWLRCLAIACLAACGQVAQQPMPDAGIDAAIATPYAGALSQTTAVMFGGTPYCNYTITLKQIAIDLDILPTELGPRPGAQCRGHRRHVSQPGVPADDRELHAELVEHGDVGHDADVPGRGGQRADGEPGRLVDAERRPVQRRAHVPPHRSDGAARLDGSDALDPSVAQIAAIRSRT
jgi:hypothetical protein